MKESPRESEAAAAPRYLTLARKIARSVVARMAASMLLLAFVLWRVDLTDVAAAIAATNLALFVAAALLDLPGLIIRAIRWRLLLRAHGQEQSVAHLSHAIMVGLFFNNLLPTSFGGDGYRALALARPCGSLAISTATVLVDRLLGVIALVAFASVALLIGVSAEVATGPIWILLVGVSALLALAFAMMHGDRAVWLNRFLPGRALKANLDRFLQALAVYRGQPRVIVAGLFWSFLLQIKVIAQFYLFGLALGLSVSIIVYALFVPIIFLLLLLPISIGGLGVREGLFAAFFSTVGVDPAQAVALSWLWYGSGLIQALYGGYMLAISRGEEKRWLLPVIRQQE
jgi:uncharacterized protein (TIRG00374 family)